MNKLFILLTILSFYKMSAQTTQYTYDNAQRLTNIVYANGLTISYAYDKLGNRISQSITTGSPLPIDLISFKAQANNCAIELTWQVGEMQNFHHFEIERSDDGSHFSTIGKVDLNNSKNYSFTDNSPLLVSNKYYNYRLKLVDNNNAYKYSTNMSVFNNCQNVAAVKVFPNPTHNFINVEIADNKNTIKKVSVLDMDGKVIYVQTVNAKSAKINLPNIATGNYMIKVETNVGEHVEKVVVE